MKAGKKVSLYIFIVVLPLITFSFVYWMFIQRSIQNERQINAKWAGGVCQNYMDQIISETKDHLKPFIQDSSSVLEMNTRKKNALLHNLKEADPRYTGAFWLNQDGVSILGTDPEQLHSYLLSQYEIDEAKNQDVFVSTQSEENNPGFKYMSIYAPILNKDDQLEGFILTQIGLDYLNKHLDLLMPGQTVKLETDSGESVLEINNEDASSDDSWLRVPLTETNWHLSVKMPKQIHTAKMNDLLLFIFIIFTLTNIVYIIVQEMIVRREEKKQKRLMDIQKLEFVGTLAASTAHEIKNPLTGIKGLVQLLNEKHPDEQDQFYYSVIMKEIERINSIVSEFLILGKPMNQTLLPYDIRAIIAELRPILESEANYHAIKVDWSIERSPIWVACTKDQLKQVILNTAKNGFEAMTKGDCLTIQVYRKKEGAEIKITDTGHGLKEADLKKVFEPFYTSKKQGTGLGLFVCKRIIENFNGHIELTSQPQEGTTVIISLPLITAETDPVHGQL